MEMPRYPKSVSVFQSALGWMALTCSNRIVGGLSFGHATAEAARTALRDAVGGDSGQCDTSPWSRKLARRLRAYAEGERDDFQDIRIDPGHLPPFAARVIACCRAIGYGETVTYRQLAQLAGSPGAARAVGNCMAHNRIPLIVPCHRVVGSDRRLRGFSAPGGTAIKQRLLDLEAQTASGGLQLAGTR